MVDYALALAGMEAEMESDAMKEAQTKADNASRRH